ncbi:MAG: acetate/propionate family kinase [Bryobacterales bacterium]|nr:acetate/propionate family kinase [Bryobacterales bacterium]
MNILVPNLGSTSLKWQIIEFPSERILARGRAERVIDYKEAIAGIPVREFPVEAVAFKAVLAGAKYRGTFRVDTGVMEAMKRFLPAAPAHNKIYLNGIMAFREALPQATLVAAFETEFHATMPECATRYGVPKRWYSEGEVQHYGFHGASHQYVAGRVPEILGGPVKRLVSCHLGGSSSMCAILEGRSVDTTMGFSPQSGLENATRHGDLDVFAVLYMMERYGWTTQQVREQLAGEGGLAGLSGIAGGDVRDLVAGVAAGNTDAKLALDVFVYEVRKTIGAYSAVLGGLDAVAFTGGIGENSAELRAEICRGFVELDAVANTDGKGDRVLSAEGMAVKAVALTTNEELVVARRAYRLLAAG